MWKLNLTAFMLLVAIVISSCGGGGASNAPGNTQTSLSGKLTIDNGLKGASALASLDGEVSVISADGELLGQTQTDASGSFFLPRVEDGSNLLKVEFDSEHQLGQDGTNDIQLLVPVEVVKDENNTLEGAILFRDMDGDGIAEGVQFDTQMNDDNDSRLIEPELGIVRIDMDEDGEFEDELELRDLDGDGLPEDAQGHENSLHGGILKGPIVSMTDEYVVVNGVMFNITDATRFKDRGNKNPDMEVFGEGTNVHIRGMWNGEEWTAIEIKTTGERDGEDDDDGEGDDDGDDMA